MKSVVMIFEMRFSLLLLLLYSFPKAQSSTCSKTTPCDNGACCSQWSNCGYGPDFCGTGCLSNCQAKSECGKYGKTSECPLHVCCSQFGFCGTTDDFCSTANKCQNNCGNVQLPTCSNDESHLIQVGYYASWSAYRSCHAYQVKNIDPRSYTHLNYAFGNISKGLMVDPTESDIISQIQEFTGLKQINPSLKVLISVGGWTFNDPGPTRYEFHNIISTSGARKQFINSVTNYLKKYNFDGIDIDYEYPGADDRGGSPEDADNYLQLVKEMRSAFGSNYVLTISAPASYWYLQNFKIGAMSQYVDFINVMTYDIHGTWDETIKSLGPYVNSHTNIKEVEEAFQLFIRDGVKSNKLVFGLAYYGRSFTLSDPSCTKIGCKFSGPGKAGPCTKTDGILAWFEIEDIIANQQVSPVYDAGSMSKILIWNKDQWVAYDDEQTLALRRQYAAQHCLKGVMIWSIDMGLDSVTDNTQSLSSPGQINFVTMNVLYQQIDDNTFAFQINGNADNRLDYQVLSVSVTEEKGNSRRKRGGPSNSKTCSLPSIYVLQNAGRGIPIIARVLRDIYQRLTLNLNGLQRVTPNDPTNPIQEAIVRTTTHGGFFNRRQTQRTEFVAATITPLHYRRNNRVDFPNSGNTSTTYMRDNMDALPGDERGHIVASVVTGPPLLYNMFPQFRGVNRNYLESHILIDWYQTENRIQDYLANNRGNVRWEVALAYDDMNLGRPSTITYAATFLDFQGNQVDQITGTLRNCEGSMVLPGGRRCGL